MKADIAVRRLGPRPPVRVASTPTKTDTAGPHLSSCSHHQLDCNDGNSNVNPGRVEVCSNGIDDDCMSGTDDACLPPPTVSVTNVSSSALTHGSSYTITGTGFGAKTTVAPLRWDDFDSGTIGATLPDQDSGGWTTLSVQPGKEPRYSNAVVRWTGSLSLYQDFTEGNYSSSLSLWGLFDGEIYLSGWFYRTTSGALSRNFKWIQMRQFDLDDACWEFRQDAYPSTDSGHIYVSNCSAGQQIGCDDEIGISGYTAENCNMYYGMNGDLKTGAWHRYKIWLTQGVPYFTDSHVRINLDSSEWMYMDGPFLPGDCRFQNLWLAFYFATDTGSPTPSMETWWDELYVDTTQARVEIGDAATFDGCSHREIQIPQNTWNDTTIQFKTNKGTFITGHTYYLYVVDGSGNVNSNGYAVTFN